MVELLTREGSTMPQARQGSQKRKASRAALHVWGAAGLSLAMAGSASANAPAPAVDGPSPDSAKRIVLSEEEIADVSLGTFYVFDREREASPGLRLAGGCHAGGGCGCHAGGGCGCHVGGCGGCRGCRGCGGCGGLGAFGLGLLFGGCGGCGGCYGSCLVWSPALGRWIYAC